MVYRKQGGALSLESAAFGGGRFVATATGVEPHYFITDHLGSVRAVVNAVGEVTERNDYFPYGLRWENPASLISDNRHRYNGKEEQTFVGLPYTDYGARMRDPKFRPNDWNGGDMLAEERMRISPYGFCSGNPILRVDLNGMLDDEYKLKEDGAVELLRRTNDDKDRLLATNNDGIEVVLKDVPKGILSELTMDKSNSATRYKGTYAKTENNPEATKQLFEFVNKHSRVEWGFNRYKNRESVVYTSWHENDVMRVSGSKTRNGISLPYEFGIPLASKITDSHSHTVSSVPSKSDNNGYGDIPFKNNQTKKAPDIQFYIYYDGKYYEY